MEAGQPLCLSCASLGELAYLPAGEATLTRRAAKYSRRSAVAVRFSRSHPCLSIQQQCELLGVPRSTCYYQPRPESAENLRLLRQLDQLYLKRPFFGSRKMAVYVLSSAKTSSQVKYMNSLLF